MMSLRSRLINDVKFGPANTGEAEENVGECEAIYPAGKEKTAQKEDRSNFKNPVSRSLKTS